MGDYSPVRPGSTFTATAACLIAGGDPVMIAGSGLVRRVNVSGVSYAGIAAGDAGAGDRLTVHAGGGAVHEGPADGLGVTGSPVIRAGDAVIAAWSPPRQVRHYEPPALPTGNDVVMLLSVIGIALTDARTGIWSGGFHIVSRPGCAAARYPGMAGAHPARLAQHEPPPARPRSAQDRCRERAALCGLARHPGL